MICIKNIFLKLYSFSLKPPFWIKINSKSLLAHFSAALVERFMNPGETSTPTLGNPDINYG
jgi:hypothetical protein